MDTTEVVALVHRVAEVDVGASRAAVCAAMTDLTRLRAWCDGREVALARAATAASPAPESDLASAGRVGAREVDRALKRSRTGSQMPEVDAALQAGRIGGGHVDALSAGLAGLAPELQSGLAGQAGELVAIAAQVTPDEFARVVRRRVRGLEADDGRARLDRQRSRCRLRTWTDRETGMWRMAGEFDPVTGVMIHNQLQAALAALFAETVPDGCPTDPGEKQDHLRALALAALIDPEHAAGVNGRGRAAGGVTVVVDTRDLDDTGHPRVDWGLDVDIPFSVAAEYARRAKVTTVVMDDEVVVSAPGVMDLGRSTRVANAAQRRVLRVWYPTCAVPACTVRYGYTKAHHVIWWRHGGMTDLANLLPLCERHHHRVHDDGWGLTLGLDRTLTITYPDGSIQTTGPPSRRVG